MKQILIIICMFLFVSTACKSDEPELPVAREYEIVGMHETVLMTDERKAGIWYITSDADTYEGFAQTTMRAAYDLHKTNPGYDLLEVMLVPDKIMVATATYYAFAFFAPDKKGAEGLSGVDQNTMKPFTWFVRAADKPLTDEELDISRLWYLHQNDFPQEDMLSSLSYDKVALTEFIADYLGIEISEVNLPALVLSEYIKE